MAKSKYMTGEEFADKQLAWMLRLHPIAVWRAKKLAKKLDEVMKECSEIQSIDIFNGRVFCHRYASGLCVPMTRTAVAVFKLWVVKNPVIIEKVFASYGFRCCLSEIPADRYDDYYYIERYENE